MAAAIVVSKQEILRALEPTDTRVLESWLHSHTPRTRRTYSADAARLLLCVEQPLQHVTLVDLQAFADSLAALAPASQARTLSAIKSLFTFAHKTGYPSVNVAAALRLPTRKEPLGERILRRVPPSGCSPWRPSRAITLSCGCSTVEASASPGSSACARATARSAARPGRF